MANEIEIPSRIAEASRNICTLLGSCILKQKGAAAEPFNDEATPKLKEFLQLLLTEDGKINIPLGLFLSASFIAVSLSPDTDEEVMLFPEQST